MDQAEDRYVLGLSCERPTLRRVGLSSDQRRIAALLLGEGRRQGATARPLKALLEAGLVESNLSNVPAGRGDRDSVGVLQQRPSQGWANGASPTLAARDFLSQAIKLNASGFKGSAGELAQAVQRSAFPGRYDERAGEAASIVGGAGASAGSGSSTSNEGPAQPWDTASAGPGLADLLGQLQAQRKPQQPASMGVQSPAFSAAPALPQGYQAAQSGGGAAVSSSGDNLAQMLQAVSATAGQDPTSGSPPTASAAQTGPEASPARGGGHSPTGKRGKIIGTPYAGTHTLGDWQSDNAVDIGVPVGTPMVSLDDGVVVKVKHHPQGAGRFAGDQVTIRGKHGNSYFYAHGTATVKAGDSVRRGQQIGETGSANGVAHLHLGVEHGDPRKIIRRGR